MRKNQQSLRDIQDTIKLNNICEMGIPEEEREKQRKNI